MTTFYHHGFLFESRLVDLNNNEKESDITTNGNVLYPKNVRDPLKNNRKKLHLYEKSLVYIDIYYTSAQYM